MYRDQATTSRRQFCSEMEFEESFKQKWTDSRHEDYAFGPPRSKIHQTP